MERLVGERGAAAYHGGRFRNEVIEAVVSETAIEWEGEPIQAHEVLMDEGDMVIFEPYTMHSASHCTNGESRYAWVNAFFDDRAQGLPHRLYQEEWAPEFLETLPPSVTPAVSWLRGFLTAHRHKFTDAVQYWCYGARTAEGVHDLDHRTRRQRQEAAAAEEKQRCFSAASKL